MSALLNKKIKKFSALLTIFGVLVGGIAGAQTTTLEVGTERLPTFEDLKNLGEKIPSPLSDFVSSLRQIQLPHTTTPVAPITPSGFLGDLEDIWNRLNNWLLEHVGLNFRSIVRLVVNLVIALLDLILQFIRWIGSLI